MFETTGKEPSSQARNHAFFETNQHDDSTVPLCQPLRPRQTKRRKSKQACCCRCHSRRPLSLVATPFVLVLGTLFVIKSAPVASFVFFTRISTVSPTRQFVQKNSWLRLPASGAETRRSLSVSQSDQQSNQGDEGVGIGIDLGTTFSAVAYLDQSESGDGVPRIIPLPPEYGGKRTMPSVVCFDNDVVHVGQTDIENAEDVDEHSPAMTCYRHVKRVLGTGGKLSKEIKDVVPYVHINPKGKTYKKNNLANQIHDAREHPTLLFQKQLNDDGITTTSIRPEAVSAEVLRALKTTAEAHLQKKVTRAVIGVPAYFHDEQRQATIRSAQMAGIDKVKLLREPEAAALAYGVGKEQLQQSTQSKSPTSIDDDAEELVLVFDLGGGTFDVSMLIVGGGLTEIISTSGNVNLGGSDFDRRVAQHCTRLISLSQPQDSQKVSRRNQNKTFRWPETATNAILRSAEKIRIHLSNNKVANLALPLNAEMWTTMEDASSVLLSSDFWKKSDIENQGSEPVNNSTHVLCQMSRKELERLCRDEFQALLRPIREVAIMSGALLPGDASPSLVEAALEMEEEDQEMRKNALAFEDFYQDDNLDSTSDSTEDEALLLELELSTNLKDAKRAQQRGRRKARDVAKKEKKFRSEKRKLSQDAEVAAIDDGKRGGNVKIRDGIVGRPISRIVLVGGATRMPAVGRLLAALTGVTPQKTVNPDEAVALGCAVHVGVLDGVDGMGTVLNPMQAAILRAFAEQQQKQEGGGMLLSDNFEDGFDNDDEFDDVEYY